MVNDGKIFCALEKIWGECWGQRRKCRQLKWVSVSLIRLLAVEGQRPQPSHPIFFFFQTNRRYVKIFPEKNKRKDSYVMRIICRAMGFGLSLVPNKGPEKSFNRNNIMTLVLWTRQPRKQDRGQVRKEGDWRWGYLFGGYFTRSVKKG